MNSHSQPLDLPGRPLPAWLLSLCVHLCLLLLLALIFRSPQAHGLTERGREVGIALTQSSDGSVDYFRPAENSAVNKAEEPASDALHNPLPAASDLSEIPLPDLALPGAASPGPTEGLIPELEFSPVRRGGLPSAEDVRAARAEDALMRQQRGTPGPATEVSLFGSAPAVGNSFVFVVDRSDSMGRSGLGVISRAKREFQQALAKLEPVHRFQIVAYNHDVVYFGGHKELVAATEPNKQLIGKFMGGLAAFGATNHVMALMSALHRSPDVVFLLTDGGDPAPSHAQMVQLLKQAQGQTTIHCIEFGRGPRRGDENFMQQLARETGGSYRYVDVSLSTDPA